MNFFGGLSKSIGIDLGTANSLFYLKGKGIVVNEPTVVAVNNRTGQILAIGSEAKKMMDRTPSYISVIRPLTYGVISDFETAEEILRHYLRKVNDNGMFSRYKLATISVPSDLTEVERKSVEDAVLEAGAAKVYLIEEPIAGALGAGLPIDEAAANMIIDIGGGTTEIAIISIGGIVISKSLKIAGDKLNEDIVKFIREEFKLAIGESTAENLKISIGGALPNDEKLEMAIRGKDLVSGLPKEVVVKNNQIRLAIAKSLHTITQAIRDLVEEAPAELVGDISRRGVYLCGGGSLLRGLDKYIEKEIGSETFLVDDPLTCVVRGLGKIVEDFPKYTHILVNQNKPREINA